MSTIICPFHYQVFERKGTDWFGKNPDRVFYNGTDRPLKLENIAEQFGLTDRKIIIELFRINGGKSGYYLANLRDRKYYYCGTEWNDIKTKLLSLGIGRKDPID